VKSVNPDGYTVH